jgi:arylsulfatase A-like enzyme
VVNSVLEWLADKPEEPFFVFAHLFDPHLPYEAGPGFAGRFTEGLSSSFSLPVHGLSEIRKRAAELGEEDRAFITAAYDEEIAYVDDQLRRLFRGLRDQGLFDSTLVILTSDHGEELFDHGLASHGHDLYGELVRVPLVMAGPGIAQGVRSPVVLSNRHLSATLAGIGGARMRGLDLRRADVVADELTFSTDHGWWNGSPNQTFLGLRADEHVLHWVPDAGVLRLFNVEQDPGEKHDLSGENADLAERLRRELQERVTELEARRETRAVPAGDATMQTLRDIGYVGDDDR